MNNLEKKSRGCTLIFIIFSIVLFLLMGAGLIKYFMLYY